MIIYTRNIYTSRNLRKAWDLSHFEDIRIALDGEREKIARATGSNLANNGTFLLAYYRNGNYAIIDVNTVGFLCGLMDDLMNAISEGKKVYDVKEYYDKCENTASLYNKYSMDMWIKQQAEKNGNARVDVLTFIWRFVTHDKEAESFRVIEHQFTTGYCYHFALIMKGMFGGKIVCHKGHGHILWQDRNKVIYDVQGVYSDYRLSDIVPVSALGSELNNYLHK